MPAYAMTKNTFNMESCLWISEGKREICLTYRYFPFSGDVEYAACIFRKDQAKDNRITPADIQNTEHTTSKRFEIRPVITRIDANCSHHNLIKSIRYLMCQKFGCKGPRIEVADADTQSESSVDYLSETKSDIILGEIDISEYTNKIALQLLHNREPVIYTKYFHTDNYSKFGYHRVIYIAFLGNHENGDLIYAASINSDIKNVDQYSDDLNHYNTALRRLQKAPVYINIPDEFRYQIDRKQTQHFEDITQIIVDNIFKRKNGFLQIRSSKNLVF